MNDEQLQTHLAQLCADPDFQRLRERLERFDPFKVLRVERYELRHTTTLAWLLDPAQTHGLGESFLRAFLAEVFGASPDGAAIPGAAPLGGRVAVQRELRLRGGQMHSAVTVDEGGERPRERKGGELDVLVESETWAVAIEAKIDSREGRDQLKDYRGYLHRRFEDKPGFRLRMLYLTVHEDPEVLAENTGWAGIQWGRHVARALEAALALRYGADPARALDACAAHERTLCEFLFSYRSLLLRLADALHGMDDALQLLANRHDKALLALKRGLNALEAGGTLVVPWLQSPAWARPYWEARAALDALLTRVRAPEARFADDIFQRLVAAGGAGVVCLSPEKNRAATIRFVPQAWADWKIDARERALPLHGLMFYRMEFRTAKNDIELKLFLPDVAEHALQAGLVRLILGPDKKRPELCLEPDAAYLERFLAGQARTLKLYKLTLRWRREDDDYRLEDGEEDKLAAFWRAVARHADALAYLVRKPA